jgi:hypothetical protein
VPFCMDMNPQKPENRFEIMSGSVHARGGRSGASPAARYLRMCWSFGGTGIPVK